VSASLEQLLRMLASVAEAVDWKVATPALIAALSGLIGAWLGSRGAVRAQLSKHKAEVEYARRSLAAALRGELLAYYDMIERRQQVQHAEAVLNRLKAGENVDLPVLLSERDEPLPSLVLANDYRAIGTLGPSIAADVARLASMIGAIRTTLTSVASGRYSHLDHPGKIDLLEGELILWRDIEIFGKRVAKRLAHVATSGR
jgi:hypothetical protein